MSSRQKFTFGSNYCFAESAGALFPGERIAKYMPRYWKGDGTVPAVVYCAALGAGAGNMLGWRCYRDITQRGFPMICADLGGTPSVWDETDGFPHFGGAAALAKLTTLINWVTAPMNTTVNGIPGLGAYPNKVILHGGSMGGQTATLYAHDFPTKIDSVFTDIAAFDPEYIRATNITTGVYPGGLAAPLVSSLGGPPIPDAKIGYKMGSTWPLAVPYYGWYEGGDLFTPESSYNTFKAAMLARGALGSITKTGDHGHTTLYCPWTTLADLTEQRALLLMG